ncbi:MFS transporter small subunit [Ferrovibrio xuzhouensis]
MNEKTSPLALIIVWAIVGIPLAWGVVLTLGNAAKLFQ